MTKKAGYVAPIAIAVIVMALSPLMGFVQAATSTIPATPNAKITALHSEITFTPYGVYVRDGIYIRAGADGLSYLLIEVPNGTHPEFYDLTGYLKTKWLTSDVANVTLSSSLYANETWEVYASYTYAPSSFLMTPFNYKIWLYNATVGNLTVFAYGPAVSVTGVPSDWPRVSYRGVTHQEFYFTAANVTQAEVEGITISGYQTAVTTADFFLTFVIIALALADGAVYYAYFTKRRPRREQAVAAASQKTVDEVSNVVSTVKTLLASREKVPVSKGDVQAVNRWISATRQRLESLDNRMQGLAARETRREDHELLAQTRDYLQAIILDFNNLFDLDLRLVTKKISEKSYEAMQKQRVKSIYRNLDKIAALLSRRASERLAFT